jgi:NADH dehydrogenase
MRENSRPHVLILGGGFGGLAAARGLAGAPVRVTLIDRQNHHLFQPMLYQVASAALNPSEIATPIRALLRNQRNVEVLLGEVRRVDAAARQVELTDGEVVEYEYLVVATGVQTTWFRRPEWAALTLGLKSLEDAVRAREQVLRAFERAERETDPERRRALLTFVVVGGGPTGVEMAGALAELRSYALARDFRRIDPREATIILVEGGPRLLPAFPADLGERAAKHLMELGVEVRTGTTISDITPTSVSAQGWMVRTHAIVWAAGTTTTTLISTLGAEQDRAGRAIVGADCALPNRPEVFVVGDAAAIGDGRGGVLPGVAQVALQGGQHVARCILADLAGRPRPVFRYVDKGSLAVIGRGQAVAHIWKAEFEGLPAWLIWALVHVAFLAGFRNRIMVLLQWGWSYLSYHRGARLITRAEGRG